MKQSSLVALVVAIASASCFARNTGDFWEHYPGFQGPGFSGIVAGDFNGDGRTEVAISGFTSESFTPTGTQLLALMDADESGRLRVGPVSNLPFLLGDSLVLSRSTGRPDRLVSVAYFNNSGHIIVLGEVPLRVQRTMPAPLVSQVKAVADVDADGRLEIVATNRMTGLSDYPAIYDYETGELEWTGSVPVHALSAAQLDDSPAWELILSAETGLIVDGATHETKWSHSGDFGYEIAIGHFGDDPERLTFAANHSSHIEIFGADPFRSITQFPVSGMAKGISTAPWPTHGDRIALADQLSGNIALYDPRTGERVTATQMPPFDIGVSQVAVADLDGDGHLELVYGSGLAHTGTDWLRAIDVETLEIDYARPSELGPHAAVALGDLSGEDRQEVVYVTLNGSGRPPLDGPILRVLNGDTGGVVRTRTRVIEGSVFYVPRVSVAQLDSDPALEIVVAATNFYSTEVAVLDGVTLQDQWRTSPGIAPLTDASLTDMALADIDGDGVPDVVLAVRPSNASMRLSRIVVLNGIDGRVLWQSPILTGPSGGDFLGAHLAIVQAGDESLYVALANESAIVLFDPLSGLLVANTQPNAPVSALLHWGSGNDCRLGALDSNGGLTLHDCRTLDILGQRQLPAATAFARPIDPHAERFVAASGADVFLVSEQDLATRIAGPFGAGLGATNQGIVSYDPVRQSLDVLIGSDYMVTRRSIAIGPIFADGFEQIEISDQ